MLHDYDIQNESNLFLAIAKLLISVLFLYCAATFIPTFVDDIRIDQGESNDQLKFRVIANSSTNADQLIKYEVVETIQTYLQNTPEFSEDIHSVENMYQEIQKTYPQLKITYKFGDNLIPPKWVAGQFYPQKEYYSVNFIIGQGRGENWFCAVFPTLCIVNEPVENERPPFFIAEWWEKHMEKSDPQNTEELVENDPTYSQFVDS
ncbi:stage II sporulation protein R [Solibacillus kalamii]|uniref:Stage II sporulation protein R n=3 Tax=Solibacillus TaxID=648800 RepID=F2F414_SOLSS|nr:MULTISPECIES: stage II sporulation protein R [Solibacillus]AMO84279.1 stage II sporulation protein SA [Solibacillus silvestris]EKB46091.1 stage II sporulation protein R [Solibacillus isronensis B3W22]MBM7664772.1 stage II sporulation protein R [Solibacillus kalamii]OBW58906.1 stage II sporulation protein SA [Solibacillus silvestris]OUZ40852.1 stage II sporulation protein SA [Solibacillus kalamii]